ncbi:LOB domain-containing protein [Quillaja saponaria]|uniref:LOB domain-containing protein n=1 Tax=Quillaja saponaria TaxID=32244 RepID=A0AAD7M5W6_QUISA|nr:LOB domain-containing protein [Quillaja saponaria]
MEFKGKTTTCPSPISVPTLISNSLSPSSSPSSQSFYPTIPSPSQSPPMAQPSPPPIIVSPCAACKILRRRCSEKCVLAPYFPPTDPLKFTIAHRVFGASNIVKFLQEIPVSQRADAVSSMVYEANARIRDPVYGCAGAICHLQKQVSELQAQLAKSQAELVNMHSQQANLVALICMEMSHSQEQMFQPQPHIDMSNFVDDNNFGSAWEPLWT